MESGSRLECPGNRVERGWKRPPLRGLGPAGILAGLALGVWDARDLLFCSGGTHPDRLGGLFLILGCASVGLVLGITLAGLGGVSRGLLAFLRVAPARVVLVGSGLALAYPAICLTGRVLSGQGVSERPDIGLLRILAPALLTIGTATILGIAYAAGPFGARWDSRWRRGALTSVCFAAAVTLHYADTNLLRDWNYRYLHELALIATIGLLTASTWLALGSFLAISSRRQVLVWILGGIAMAGLLELPLVAGSRTAAVRKTTGGAALVRWHRQWRSNSRSNEAWAESAPVASLVAHSTCAALARASLAEALPGREGWNLLWITVDTLRADHTSLHGYWRDTTPHLARLGRDSTVFESAWSQNPITHFSFQSMFHGVYPSKTPLFARMRGLAKPDLPPTLAARLSNAGWRTASVPAIPMGSLSQPIYEIMTEGFSEVNPKRSLTTPLEAPAQVALAQAWLSKVQREKFFLWLHLMDPHAPYTRNPEHDFGPGVQDRYDSEIALADAAIGRMVQHLRDSGLADRTLIIVNGDHGEGLGDHRIDHHGASLHEHQVHVPLLIFVPGLEGHRVAIPVENVDIYATVLDLLGLEADPRVQGESLVDLLLDDPGQGRLPLAVTELPSTPEPGGRVNPDQVAVRLANWKLHFDREEILELFDLASDPAEAHNVVLDHPGQVAQLRSLAQASIHGQGASANSEESPITDLRDSLAATQGLEARATLIRVALERRVPGLDELLIERLADPTEHPALAGLLLRGLAQVSDHFPRAAVDSALRSELSYGLIASALLVLDRQSRAGHVANLELYRGDLARLLDAPPPLARRAAELLAHLGDDRGQSLLLSTLESQDRRLAFRAASALLRLGDERGIPVLVSDLVAARLDEGALLAALQAVEARQPVEVVPSLIALARQKSLSLGVTVALLRASANFDWSLIGPVYLWVLARSDGSRLDAVQRLIAETRSRPDAPSIFHSGQSLKAAWAQWRANEFEAARAHLDGLRQLLPQSEFAAMAGWADDRAQGKPLRPFASTDAPRPASGSTMQHRLRPMKLRHWMIGPVRAGQDWLLSLRVRNTGPTWIPGGYQPEAPELQLDWKRNGISSPDVNVFPEALPPRGLMPDEEVWIHFRMQVGPVQGICEVVPRLGRSPAGVTWESNPECRLAVAVYDSGSPLPLPENGTYSGVSLLQHWSFELGLLPPEVEPDGSVWAIATDPDPQIVSSPWELSTNQTVLRIELSGLAVDLRHELPAQVFWNFSADSVFSPEREEPRSLIGDGSVVDWQVRTGTEGSPKLRRYRLDPGSLPDAVHIRSIRIGN